MDWFKKLMELIEALDGEKKEVFDEVVPLIRASKKEFDSVDAFNRVLKKEGFEKPEDVLESAKKIKNLEEEKAKLQKIVDENKNLKDEKGKSSSEIQELKDMIKTLQTERELEKKEMSDQLDRKEKESFISDLVQNVDSSLVASFKKLLKLDDRLVKTENGWEYKSSKGLFEGKSIAEAILTDEEYSGFRTKSHENRDKNSQGTNNNNDKFDGDDPYGFIAEEKKMKGA